MIKRRPNDGPPVRPSLAIYKDILENFDCDPGTLIHISASQQKLWLYSKDSMVFTCPVSTSSRGMGEMTDSLQTPRGLHRITSMVGLGEPEGRIFKSRVAQPDLWQKGQVSEKDLILSRILWLEGLEKGKNRGGDVDTKSRYIYIHGTNHESQIGSPASRGCIRLRNRDVITLADQWARANMLCLVEA